jgi:beta-mannosidase
VAIFCGNSEVEQQSAMLGMPRELWSNSWFAEQLPTLCASLHPGAGYVPSTPTGGVLPFQPNSGLTHYYGVGAYLRQVTDIRRADVKFTPETLGFSNIPDAPAIEAVMGSSATAMHDPRWKRRVPRDAGAGWDFGDVRDHYLRELFNVDPVQLRSWDTPRYLQLSRLVPGEMMQQAYSEWRGTHSRNTGALVWFYKDLWPGAGWGIVDSTGAPKATYYYLRRSWSNRQLLLTDEGLNGLHVHLVNESCEPCNGTVEITLLKEPNIIVARTEIAVPLPGRSRRMFSADEILGGFYDVNYAYRFGPPQHDIAIATWYDADRRSISESCHFIRRSQHVVPTVTLETSAERISVDEYRINLQSDTFLHGVHLTAKGYLPDDNYFHLPPQRNKCVVFRARSKPVTPFKVSVEALNLEATHTISFRG